MGQFGKNLKKGVALLLIILILVMMQIRINTLHDFADEVGLPTFSD